MTQALAAAEEVSGAARFADVLRSEYCKLRSVRSTRWTLLAAVLFNVGVAALLAIFLPGQLSADDEATLDATRVSLGGLHLSQLAFGLLGALAVTSEYTTGMIRTSLSAVPRRRLLLAAKAIVFAATALLVGITSCFAAYFVFQAALTGEALQGSIGDPGVLRAVLGGGVYLALLGLLALGLGATIRSSAGAVATLLSLLFVPPVLVGVLPHAWGETISPYFPTEAGSAMFSVDQRAEALGAWPGFGVLCLYAALALAAGFVLIDRRDA